MNSDPAFLPTELFAEILATSWRASWLILLLIVLRVLVRRRIPAQVWFVVWLVVAARLLVPFSVPAEWSPYNLGAAQPAATAAVMPVAELAPNVPVTAAATWVGRGVPAEPSRLMGNTARRGRLALPALSHTQWLCLGWLAGGIALLSVRALGSWRFRRQLARAGDAPERVRTLVAREAGSGNVRCVETSAVSAPALYGIARPRLLLPPGFATRLSDAELRFVIRHELAHWRRRDLLAQIVLQAAAALHWFNPLAWVALRLARIDCELACDEHVLRGGAAGESSAYGAALLKVLSVTRGRRASPSVIAILEDKQQLAQRVRMIADYRIPGVGRTLAGVSVIALVAVMSFTRETAAAEISSRAPANAQPGLNAHLKEQQAEVEALARELEELKREKENASPALGKDDAGDALRRMTLRVQSIALAMQSAAVRVKQIADCRNNGSDLRTLPFIASNPVVTDLSRKLAEHNVTASTMTMRYREKHPQMIEIASVIKQTERQLATAIETACGQVQAEYQGVAAQHQAAQDQLERMREQYRVVATADLNIRARERELEIQRQIVASILARGNEADRRVEHERATRPAGEFTVSVVGAVNVQGAVALAAKGKPIALEAIARAAGFASNADRAAVRILRATPDGTRTTITLTEEMLMNGAAGEALLRDGDVVVVPEKTR